MPYEKMELLGAKSLTNSELLAIIIKTGTKKLNCVKIAQNILMSNKNMSSVSELEYLSMLSIQELQTFEGIGKVKAIQIKAVIELAKRFKKIMTNLDKVKITSPSDVYNLVSNDYIGLKIEILKVIILNNQNKVLSVVNITSGNVACVNADIKQILAEPIKQLASSIILCHNHPSGSMKASRADIVFTNKIKEYSNIFGINLLDHVIFADNNYISMKELGYI